MPFCNVCKWKYVPRGEVCPECRARLLAAEAGTGPQADREDVDFAVKKLISSRFRNLVLMTMATVVVPLAGFIVIAQGAADLRHMRMLEYTGFERPLTRAALVFGGLWAVAGTLALVRWLF